MQFKSVHIKNFRNFDDVKISLGNKNIFFGLNDVGKTNLMYALLFIFDREVRKNNLIDSDFYCKKTESPIEITIAIDISDHECPNSQKLRAKVHGGMWSEDDPIVYIRLTAMYSNTEGLANPILYWGSNLENLEVMKQKGIFYAIDEVINVIYIDSYTDLQKLFKRNISALLKNLENKDEDKRVLENIDNLNEQLNENISSLSGVKSFEEKISKEYEKFRQDEILITVKSELAVKGFYNNLIPYIKHKDECNLYPTSGEGRKKILSYSIYGLLAKELEDEKINLFLIEEPENHLHKTLQITLSKILFSGEGYPYLFVTTHSPYIVYEMDGVNLVRIFNKNKIDSGSALYVVPEEYQGVKGKLNKDLAEAIFADKVLLVEGDSEVLLFSKVLSYLDPLFETKGIFILPVEGIDFKPYVNVLDNLKINRVIKTDNDLRKPDKDIDKYSVLGFSRCNFFIKDVNLKLPTEQIDENSVTYKRELYVNNEEKLNQIREEYNVFLSKCDLENDLAEAIQDRLEECLGTEAVVEHLQKKKKYHMVELVNKLTKEDCIKIFNHYNFACLKKVLE